MQQLTLQVDGMSCSHCVTAVTEALTAVPGVTVERVSVGQAVLMYQPGNTNVGDIIDALDDIGYEANEIA